MARQECLQPGQKDAHALRQWWKWAVVAVIAIAAAVVGFFSVPLIWPRWDIQQNGLPKRGPEAPVNVDVDAKEDRQNSVPPPVESATGPPNALTHGGTALRLSRRTEGRQSSDQPIADSVTGFPDPAAPIPAAPEALFEEALSFAYGLQEAFPAKPDALEVQARLLEWLGRSKEAVGCWERALQLDPNYAHAHLGLGIVAAKNEDYAKAVERLRKAVELNPGHFPARIALADALLALGQPKEVIALLEDYMRRHPRSQGYFLLGQACAQLQQYEKARENFEAAVRKYPEFGEAYYRLSTVCARLGQQQKARQYLQKSRELKAAQRENERVARKEYDDLNAARSRVAETYATAARIYYTDAKPRQAEWLWRRAADLDAKNVECRQGLAWLCRQEGRIAETIAILEQLAKIEPNNPSYRPEIERLRAAPPK